MILRPPHVLIAVMIGLGPVGIASSALPAAAQRAVAPRMGGVMARIQLAFETTDRRIEQAERLVASSPDARNRGELDEARGAQMRARAAADEGRPRIALRLTLEAREHAQRVLSELRSLPDSERAGMQVERTNDIIDRARQRTQRCDAPELGDALAGAGLMQTRAESALASGRALAAIELTMNARERAFRALRLCHVEDDLRASVQVALQRTDDVLAHAREATAGSRDEGARHMAAQAAELQSKAAEEFRAEHHEESLRLTQTARAMGRRATRAARGR